MYLRRRRRLTWSRILFLISGLILCAVYQLSIGNFQLSASRRAQLWEGNGGGQIQEYLSIQSRKLLQTNSTISAQSSTPGTPRPGVPRTSTPWTPRPGVPRTSTPWTPRPGVPRTSTPWTPRPGVPRTWTPGTPRPGVPRTSTPGTPRPGVPRTSTPGTPRPGIPRTWTPRPGVPRTSTPVTPPNTISTTGITSTAEITRPAVTEKPRLRGCILVGNEIIPAPTPAPVPDTSSTEPGLSTEPDRSREPPLGHTKGEYPVDLFSVEDRRQGWVMLHILGMVYMFIALALVCDEFFVPSLGTIIEKLQISDDVAGATFMAAGGSAPELFTSLIGVFISHSNVGIGTIVGSAVFNILFVIGMCAIFSREILRLTWWPLFRDVSFYIVDLIMLIVFFLDNVIVWWESVCLLCGYISYVSFMKFNGDIERWFKRNIVNNNNVVKVMSMISSVKGKRSPMKKQSAPNSPPESNTNQHQPNLKKKSSDSEPSEEEKVDNNWLKPKSVLTRGSSTPSLHNSMLRNTIFQLMINTLDPLTQVKFKQKAEVMNSMAKGKGRSKDQQGNKMKDEETDEKTDLPTSVNVEVTPPTDPPTTTSSPTADAEDEANPTKDQEADDMKGEDDRNDDGGGKGGGDGGSDGSDDDDDSDDSDEDSDDDDEDNEDEDEDEDEDEANEDEPLSLQWPETRRKQVTYLCLLPIVFPLWLTVPDVRNAASKKYFIGTFLGSIMWIGTFSYMMVWWAHQVGETIGISEEIMGLTILAAGTSIPDLITSVIVARKGLGDMAVSSSVGSNIFDITVGLPVPWLLYAAFNRLQPVPVSSNGLFCAIVLLFLMLLFVIISIGLSKWKLNKILGFTMFCLYFMFLIISVMLEDRIIVCPVSI